MHYDMQVTLSQTLILTLPIVYVVNSYYSEKHLHLEQRFPIQTSDMK